MITEFNDTLTISHTFEDDDGKFTKKLIIKPGSLTQDVLEYIDSKAEEVAEMSEILGGNPMKSLRKDRVYANLLYSGIIAHYKVELDKSISDAYLYVVDTQVEFHSITDGKIDFEPFYNRLLT